MSSSACVPPPPSTQSRNLVLAPPLSFTFPQAQVTSQSHAGSSGSLHRSTSTASGRGTTAVGQYSPVPAAAAAGAMLWHSARCEVHVCALAEVAGCAGVYGRARMSTGVHGCARAVNGCARVCTGVGAHVCHPGQPSPSLAASWPHFTARLLRAALQVATAPVRPPLQRAQRRASIGGRRRTPASPVCARRRSLTMTTPRRVCSRHGSPLPPSPSFPVTCQGWCTRASPRWSVHPTLALVVVVVVLGWSR